MKGLRIQNIDDLKPCILLVDDEVFNLEILVEILEDCGYVTETAQNGHDACDLIKNNPDKYQMILLDRMMPDIDGIEVWHYIKRQPHLAKVPVILQSAKAAKQDVQEGLDAGVLYYLPKPFTKDQLLAIVDTAVAGYFNGKDSDSCLTDQPRQQFCEGELQFCSMDEARNTASLLSSLCPDPQRIELGLSELFVNAVEHGNLGIVYQEKLDLIAQGNWLAEVERRLQLPENRDKKVRVKVCIENEAIYFDIKDDGMGFDYENYLEFNRERSTNSHGRGIAIAKTLSFDELEYLGNGNQVRLKVNMQ